MGAWGSEPWDNDSAADWFAGLFEGTPIVERITAGLASDDSSEMVAALWLCTELVRVYVWPIADFDTTLEAAITAADQLLSGDDPDGYLELWDDDEDVRRQLEGYRSALIERRAPSS